MTTNQLNFDASYILSTIQKTITNVAVKVVGIVDYATALNFPFQLSVLALNEKVVPSSSTASDITTYLSSLSFYICKSTVDNSTIYIVWDAIIDYTATVASNHITSATLQMTIDSTVTDSDTTIMQNIVNFLNTNYNGKVQGSFLSGSTTVIDPTQTILQSYESLMQEASSVLQGFQALSSLIPFLNNIGQLNVAGNLTNIQNQITQISSSLARIVAAVS